MSTLRLAEEDFLLSDIRWQFWKEKPSNNVHYLTNKWIVSTKITNTVDNTSEKTAKIIQLKK